MATRPTRKAKTAGTPSDAAAAPAPAETKTNSRRTAKAAEKPATVRGAARKASPPTEAIAAAKPARTAGRRKAESVAETVVEAVAAVPEKATRAVAARGTKVRKSAPVARVEKAATDAVEAVKGEAKAVADTAKSAAGSAKAAVVSATDTAKAGAKGAGAKAKSFLPDFHLPSTTDASAFVKSVGGQIATAMNSDVGRVMIAELLMIVAGSLTAAAAKTETGRDAKTKIIKAGAKIGAAAANAGAKIVETGSQAASTGSSAAGEAVDGAKGVAREVAHMAVSAVGGVVVDAATKVLGRGRGRKAVAALPAPESSAPSAPVRGTRRPPRL